MVIFEIFYLLNCRYLKDSVLTRAGLFGNRFAYLAIGVVIGDLMVAPRSGTDSPQLDPTTVAVLGGVHHFDLLNDAEVVETVMRWLLSSA